MTIDLQDLEKNLTQTLEDTKAEDILSLDVRHLTSITDKILICTGTSRRHVQAVAEHALTTSKKMGCQPLGVEGTDSSEWVLIDLGSLVLHIMLPELRQFYSLEKLWAMTESTRKTS